MEKLKFEAADLELIALEAKDIVTLSNGEDPDSGDLWENEFGGL